MLSLKYSVLLTGAGLLLSLSLLAQAAAYSFDGDVRGGYFTLHRDERTGAHEVTDEWRLRLRAAVTTKFNAQWQARARFAGRYSTDKRNAEYFTFFDKIPSGDGLRRGDSTLDEMYVDYKASKQWQVRVGRFQSSFELKGVAKKSLDRNNSPNTDITWTDGLRLRYQAGNGWQSTFIAQYNDNEGATEVRRGPLDFSDDGSRWSYFVSLQNRRKLGPIVQREIDVTWLPDALYGKGVAAGSNKDYWGIVGRLAAQWPLGDSGTKFMLSGALGYAPTTPDRSAVKTGSNGDADGMAAQVSFNFIDIIPKHSLGLLAGRAGDGWLLSPDFRDNTNLYEARYKWIVNKKQKLEARFRYRVDIDQRVGVAQDRVDKDLYVRYTLKF